MTDSNCTDASHPRRTFGKAKVRALIAAAPTMEEHKRTLKMMGVQAASEANARHAKERRRARAEAERKEKEARKLQLGYENAECGYLYCPVETFRRKITKTPALYCSEQCRNSEWSRVHRWPANGPNAAHEYPPRLEDKPTDFIPATRY